MAGLTDTGEYSSTVGKKNILFHCLLFQYIFSDLCCPSIGIASLVNTKPIRDERSRVHMQNIVGILIRSTPPKMLHSHRRGKDTPAKYLQLSCLGH